jgi:hypothetical protein
MLKEMEGEQPKVDSDIVDTAITYDCCSESPTIQPVTTRMKEREEDEFDDEEHDYSDNQNKKQFYVVSSKKI